MMAKKTRAPAQPAPKTDHVPPALPADDLARLPDDIRTALSIAARTGRYYVAVVRLDSEFRQLNLQRYIQDIPTADIDRIETLIREDLKNVR